MAEDFLKPVTDLISKTPNTTDGMRKIVVAAEAVTERIDLEIIELLRQRDRVMVFARNYGTLYEALAGETLREIENYETYLNRQDMRQPEEAKRMERGRQDVLRYAEAGSKNDGKVTDSWIMASMGWSPWKNPKAVIATILARSGKWKKIKDGEYEKVRDE